MLLKYLKFGRCNCSKNFMVMSRCHACASVIFVDLSEHSCWYLLIMFFYGIKLINAFLLSFFLSTCGFLVILGYVCAYESLGWC